MRKCPARKATTSTTLVLSAIHLLLLQEMKLHKHCTQKMLSKTLVSCTHSNSEVKWSFLKYFHPRRSYACKKKIPAYVRTRPETPSSVALKMRQNKYLLPNLDWTKEKHAYREKSLCTCINLPKTTVKMSQQRNSQFKKKTNKEKKNITQTYKMQLKGRGVWSYDWWRCRTA